MTIAAYSYSNTLFGGGNEYVRFASVPPPAGFSEPPTVIMSKCGSDNSISGVSAVPRVTSVTRNAVEISFTTESGSLPNPFKQAFSLIAIGV